MNRFRKAWLALAGKLEPEVVEVEVGIEPVALYQVDVDTYGVTTMYRDGNQKLDGATFPTCEAAFSAISGFDYFHVEEVQAFRIGRRYFRSDAELKVGKPKRAKGKRG